MAGVVSPGALIGVALGLIAALAALTLTRGVVRLAAVEEQQAARRLAARWCLDRIVSAIERAGLGVCGGVPGSCVDEAVEWYGAEALAVRADFDRDDPAEQATPERSLGGPAVQSQTGNDELFVFLRRRTGREPELTLDADLDGSDRITLSDGTLLARRDGAVDSVALGAAQASDDGGLGVLYRISFSHDARWFGTGRFRVTEPLADGAASLRFEGFDRYGAPVAPCGGADDPTSRACRAALRSIRVGLTLAGPDGRTERFSAEARLR